MNTYFANDGSYGSATGMVVFDTRAWGPEEWDAIDSVSDSDRVRVAIAIAIENGDV